MWQRDYSSSPQSNSTSQVQTFSLPNLIGYSQADLEQWKFQNQLKVHFIYNTAIGYDHSVSCFVAKQGNVVSQNPRAGVAVTNAYSTGIWLSIDC
jgi:hypothetical protein